MANDNIVWETFCKRTSDPKLAYIESVLLDSGIPCRRNGESWHAPILQIPSGNDIAAWEILNASVNGQDFDEIPDNDPMFSEFQDYDELGDDDDY